MEWNNGTCYDINGCANNPCGGVANANTTGTNGGCSDFPAPLLGYNCTCNQGFRWSNGTCVDIDECTVGTAGCSGPNSTCTNSPGSFACGCAPNSRYTLGGAAGKTCVDTDGCAPNQCLALANTNTTGAKGGCTDVPAPLDGFTCTCMSGFRWNDAACVDFNECASGGGALCNGPSSTCDNTIGSYTCRCGTGYNLTGQYTCVDVNECLPGGGALCNGNTSTCTNTNGSYTCGCGSGYALSAADNATCIDIDECTAGTAGCMGPTVPGISGCRNTPGGFQCTCAGPFWTLSTVDNKTCVDVNECATQNGGCAQNCTNNVGAARTCFCRSGYTLDPNGVSCTDVDECQTVPKMCEQGCTNDIGSYQCFCREGYNKTADGRNCTDFNECLTPNKGGCQGICTNIVGPAPGVLGYTCTCEDPLQIGADDFSCTPGCRITIRKKSGLLPPNQPRTLGMDEIRVLGKNGSIIAPDTIGKTAQGTATNNAELPECFDNQIGVMNNACEFKSSAAGLPSIELRYACSQGFAALQLWPDSTAGLADFEVFISWRGTNTTLTPFASPFPSSYNITMPNGAVLV